LKTIRKGDGIFSLGFIPANTFVGEYFGPIVSNAKRIEMDNSIYKDNKNHYWFFLNNKSVINGYLSQSPMRYVNHSHDPNVFAEIWFVFFCFHRFLC
jgi:SET domain-containing protein